MLRLIANHEISSFMKRSNVTVKYLLNDKLGADNAKDWSRRWWIKYWQQSRSQTILIGRKNWLFSQIGNVAYASATLQDCGNCQEQWYVLFDYILTCLYKLWKSKTYGLF